MAFEEETIVREWLDHLKDLNVETKKMFGCYCLYEVIPVLVLTRDRDLFRFVPIGRADAVLPVCSGDMLFNVFNEYLGFLK